jgi:hypothetical protein
VTGCAVSVSIVGIVDKLWIDAVPGLRNIYNDRIYAINTSNGPNEDIETGDADSIWLSEASDRFSVGGLKGGWDGRQLEVVNATAQPATLSNNDSDASPGNRICTPVGADVTLASRDDFATLTYSATANCWVVSKLKPRPPQLTQIARDVIEIGANACDRDTQCVARSQFRCEAVCKNAIQLKNSAVKLGYFPGSREKMPVNFPPDD